MAAPGGQQGQPIPITSLSLEQLSNLKQQFEEVCLIILIFFFLNFVPIVIVHDLDLISAYY